MIRFRLPKPSLPWLRTHLRAVQMLAISGTALLVLVVLTPVVGGPVLVSLNGAVSKEDVSGEVKAAEVEPSSSPSPSPLTPSPSNSPVGKPQPAREEGGAVIAGKKYGAHLVNEPTSSTWSTKPLGLSTHDVTVAAGQYSGGILVTSPDGQDVCNVGGNAPGDSGHIVYANTSSMPPCSHSHTVNVFVPSSQPAGTITIHVQAYTSTKVWYDGYITVTVKPPLTIYDMPAPTMAPAPTTPPPAP